TFFVQQVMHYSPVKAGLAFVPVAFIIGIVSQIVAQLLPKVGPKVLIATGSILMTLSLLWLSTVNADAGYLDKIFPGMLVLAVGCGAARQRGGSRGRPGAGSLVRHGLPGSDDLRCRRRRRGPRGHQRQEDRPAVAAGSHDGQRPGVASTSRAKGPPSTVDGGP